MWKNESKASRRDSDSAQVEKKNNLQEQARHAMHSRWTSAFHTDVPHVPSPAGLPSAKNSRHGPVGMKTPRPDAS